MKCRLKKQIPCGRFRLMGSAKSAKIFWAFNIGIHIKFAQFAAGRLTTAGRGAAKFLWIAILPSKSRKLKKANKSQKLWSVIWKLSEILVMCVILSGLIGWPLINASLMKLTIFLLEKVIVSKKFWINFCHCQPSKILELNLIQLECDRLMCRF